MYAMTQPISASLNGGGIGGRGMDAGTIDPSQLNSPVMIPGVPPGAPGQHPGRGLKRSRSPDQYGDHHVVGDRHDDDDSKQPRKRGRPPKVKLGQSPHNSVQAAQAPHMVQAQNNAAQPLGPPVQTPQHINQSIPNHSPSQVSPPKATPTKPTVIKALPTVRDHTTDQLGPEGDEYIPREHDESGEQKVAANGAPLGGREYICRTFYLPNRGEKLFMLATECARNLNYRDSYLLFNKNRSLFKIIATQAEKDHLISQDVLPYSYRSRQIAIVTARSMFRQFGSRLIHSGRRVRDDYWEAKARKQGFTEEDAAGEKRPGGAAKKRAAEAAEAGTAHANLTALPHGDIIYNSAPTQVDGHPAMAGTAPTSLAPLPMINLAPNETAHQRDYGHVPRPRQEISGPAYQDRAQPSSTSEILTQAAQTAEFNRNLNQGSAARSRYQNEIWNRSHASPAAQQQQLPGATEPEPVANHAQNVHSPSVGSGKAVAGNAQQSAMHSQGQAQMLPHQGYAQQPHSQIAQSPLRPTHQQLRNDQMHQRAAAGMHIASSGPHGQSPSPYAYQQPHQSQMWHPTQAQQQSSLSQSHHNIPQYGQAQHGQQQQQPQQAAQSQQAHQHQHQQQSPHAQQSPLHTSQQLHHPSAAGHMPGQPMGFQTMAGMGGSAAYSSAVNRTMYQQHNPTPQHYMHQGSPAQQQSMQTWPYGQPQPGQQQW